MTQPAAAATTLAPPSFMSESMGKREVALTLGALMLCIFLAGLDTAIVANALPKVVADLNGFELYAWVTTAYLLCSTAVTPIAGKLGDRYGRKPMLVYGAIFFLGTTLLCGLTQNMPELIVLRAMQGVGGGVLNATVFATMGQLLPPADRARISGLITAVYSLANVTGPVVGGFLTDAISWRAVFYVTVPIGVVALIVIWRLFPPVRYGSTRHPIDIGGALTSMLGIVLLLLALSWGGRDFAWDSPQVLGTLVGGVVMLGAFLWIEAHAPDPILPLKLLRNNVVAISSTNSVVQSMGQIGLSLFVPLYAQGVLGTSATVSGTIMLPMLGAMLVSNLSAGFLIARVERYKIFAVIGFCFSLAGYAALTTIGQSTPYWMLALCLTSVGFGTGMVFPTLTLSYQCAVEFHELGVATSLNQFSRSMGSTLGSALFGSILIMRFVPEVRTNLPGTVSGWLDTPAGGAVRDPQALLNPSAADALRASLEQAFPNAPATADLVLAGIRSGLAGSLHWVFGAGAVLIIGGLLGSLFWQEVPMRRAAARVVDSGSARGVSAPAVETLSLAE